jgi:hypothetical protein
VVGALADLAGMTHQPGSQWLAFLSCSVGGSTYPVVVRYESLRRAPVPGVLEVDALCSIRLSS